MGWGSAPSKRFLGPYGSCSFHRISFHFSIFILKLIYGIPRFSTDNRWITSILRIPLNGQFQTSMAYKSLPSMDRSLLHPKQNLQWIWKINSNQLVKHFLWLTLQQRIGWVLVLTILTLCATYQRTWWNIFFILTTNPLQSGTYWASSMIFPNSPPFPFMSGWNKDVLPK